MDHELKVDVIDDEMVAEVGLRSVNSLKARDAIAPNFLHHGLAKGATIGISIVAIFGLGLLTFGSISAGLNSLHFFVKR
ncbi:unnamed protein product [Trifolium pratense]|uniref:Uncharacterized protein n=1 Tax=Trifolium pratense TaxID=57577 RepID=A0ACB0KY69_TRIPR|nr:unnamed protein product [Trifolium pratense]